MNTTYYIIQNIKGGEVLFCSESKELAEEFKKAHDYMHSKPAKMTEFTNPDVSFPKGLLIYAIADYKVDENDKLESDVNVKINLIKPCDHHEYEEFYIDTSSNVAIKGKKKEAGLFFITHDVRCYIDTVVAESSFMMKDRAAKFIIDHILSERESGLDKR